MLWHWAGVITVFYLLQRVDGLSNAWRALALAGPVLVWIHYRLWTHLHQDGDLAGGDRIPSLGVANQITLARGWGVSLMAGCILYVETNSSNQIHLIAWWVSGLYLMIAVADFFDGFWARRTGTETQFGQKMDTEIDALGLLVASVLAIRMGHLPYCYLLVGFSYYAFRLGVWHRRNHQKAVHPLSESFFRRQIAGIQMGFVGLGLLPVFHPFALKVAAFFFMLPFLAGFIWDWMTVSGRLTDAARQRGWQFAAFFERIWPLSLRLLLVIMGIVAAQHPLSMEMLHWPYLCWGVWFCMVLGIAGRFGACGASILMALEPGLASDPLIFSVLMGCTTGLIMFGTGKWSLWQPERRFFEVKLGSPGSPAINQPSNQPQAASH
jgi:phosphatidylglycerophosphate synthase